MSVIAATSINNDEELQLDAKTWDKLKQIDIEEVDQYLSEESSDNENEENFNAPGLSKDLAKMQAKDEAEQRKAKV